MANQIQGAFTATYWTGVRAKEEEKNKPILSIYLY